VDTDGAIKAAICRRPRAALRPMLALFVEQSRYAAVKSFLLDVIQTSFS
jgi:hypothetical protein